MLWSLLSRPHDFKFTAIPLSLLLECWDFMSCWVGIGKRYALLWPWYVDQGQACKTSIHLGKNECNTDIFPSKLIDENQKSVCVAQTRWHRHDNYFFNHLELFKALIHWDWVNNKKALHIIIYFYYEMKQWKKVYS